MSHMHKEVVRMSHGKSLLSTVLIVFIVMFVAFLLLPIYYSSQMSESRGDRHSPCQSNMKELGTALALYQGDYGAMLPCSGLNGQKKWDLKRYERFATRYGVIPPPANYKDATWVMLLYPFTKNKDIIWCPREVTRHFLTWEWETTVAPPARPAPSTVVSYWYKGAIDAAWFGGPDGKGPICRKEGDFDFPSDQIIFYENAGWHWGQEKDGLANGVTINVTYLDGHVASKRIKSSTNRRGQSDPLAPGEPGWFNYDFANNKDVKIGRHSNPQVYGDQLP